MGFPGGAVVKNPPANAEDTRDVGLITVHRRYPGIVNGNPLRYSCLENSMDRGAWKAPVHGVAKSHRWLSTHTEYKTNQGRLAKRNKCLQLFNKVSALRVETRHASVLRVSTPGNASSGKCLRYWLAEFEFWQEVHGQRREKTGRRRGLRGSLGADNGHKLLWVMPLILDLLWIWWRGLMCFELSSPIPTGDWKRKRP